VGQAHKSQAELQKQPGHRTGQALKQSSKQEAVAAGRVDGTSSRPPGGAGQAAGRAGQATASRSSGAGAPAGAAEQECGVRLCGTSRRGDGRTTRSVS
jgi:hypothetical protein